MTAALMVYALVVSVPLAAAAVALESVLALRRRPRRFVWLGALVVVTALSVLTPWQAGRKVVGITSRGWTVAEERLGIAVRVERAVASGLASSLVQPDRRSDAVAIPASLEARKRGVWKRSVVHASKSRRLTAPQCLE